jgi:long-chain fatty acid transport protein
MNVSDWKRSVSTMTLGLGTLALNTAHAGGISLYEVGTADVGLAAAGYAARAQDASTVFTNPAGMTRLVGNQVTFGAQALHGDVGFSIGQGTTAALGDGAGGNPVGWLPGGGVFYSHSVSSDFKVGLAVTGNFGSKVKYDEGWVGRYRAKEGTLLGMSVLPSAAWRVNENLSVGASLNAMFGKFDNKVAVNNITGSDGELSLDDKVWGFGANLGLLYELNQGTRFGITYNSAVDLDFRAQAQWDGLAPGLRTLLASRGLLDANVDLGVTVPQGVNAGFFHQVDPRWAVLGSIGWQRWSKFGEVEVGVDSNNPVGLTTRLDFKDTWHVSGGVQHRWSDSWLINGGIAYDSGFQDKDNVALALPANAAWRFGIGLQKEESKSFNWGLSFEYLYGGSLHTNVSGSVPVALGGRGDVVGSFNNVEFFFLAANCSWKF